MKIRPGLLPEATILLSTKEEGTMSLRHGGDSDAIYQRRIRFVTESLGYLPHVAEIMPNGLGVFRVGHHAAHQIASNALFTTEQDILLTLTPADCHPIFVIDPMTPAIALIHGGRKEATSGIVAKTLDQMTQGLGTDPSLCTAIVGPGIRCCCYLLERISDDERDILNSHCMATRGGWAVDLVGFHQETLRSCGLVLIDSLPWCTACSSELFFSHYRSFRDGLPEERFFSGIVMSSRHATFALQASSMIASNEVPAVVAA